MKKLNCLLLGMISMAATHAQGYAVVKCLSGDCSNGAGAALVTNEREDPKDWTYTGSFRGGKLSGEGTLVNDQKYFIGGFDNSFQKGYGSMFYSKQVNGVLVPDSVKYAEFGLWDGDGCYRMIDLQGDNSKVFNYGSHGAKIHQKFIHDYNNTWGDAWIKEHVAALQMSPARSATPVYQQNIIAEKSFNVRRGTAVELIQWDCDPAIKYFVTASALKGNAHTVLPFGGSVNYQVQADDGSVVFEGAADNYWTPQKAGHYSFLVKFDQDVSGNSGLLVDYVSLICSLRSKRRLN